ncbi:hypothetical protein ACER0C_031832 [Sarotherodon galilaeus]
MADEWQVVRYGRRRQRLFLDNPGRDRGFSRGMARAPSFYPRRRNQFPYPSRPAPPTGNFRYRNTQSRSFADVVRQSYPRPPRRGFSPRGLGNEVRRQPADPQFGRLVRKMHGVIKMVHHLQNVAVKPGENTEPRMISRMVEVLSDMIKPAAPTERTLSLIQANAKNWGHTTCQILMEHYEAGLADLLEELSELLVPDWKPAFEVAECWAKRNLSRITQAVLEHAEALITTVAEDGQHGQIQVPQQTERPAQPEVPQARGTSTATTTTSRVSTTTSKERRYLIRQRGPRQGPKVMVSAETMTDSGVQDEDWPQVGSHAEPPKERRRVRQRRDQEAFLEVIPENAEDQEESEVPVYRSEHPELEALFDEMQREEEAAEAAAAALHSSAQDEDLEQADIQVSPVLRVSQVEVHREEDSAHSDDLFEDSFDHFTSPEPPRFRVKHHPNTQRKLTDWSLEVEKKWLIMGDSNVCRFPDFLNSNLQVDSFPGAHFRHAQALMEKTTPPPDLVVEKIILSFGINSRANKSKETTVKNLQGALRSAKRKFPYAEIWIPLINFSPNLPREEQENLQTLNEHLIRNMPYIPLLPEEDFETELDDVHWTSDTARAMFEHWMATLNSTAP